ncbi:hypothetical protein HHL19_35515 [Streptomyces sp. R302]|uniref:hypothetical protein n=1 Tax=unclassified Streptomyces TaxID=2593676 RepID=UPI00145D7B40|nr:MULTISPECIES: hypothetical protein [unclassified Streptomyces]NML55151.1 hypothetical protein [Streptomyces sp. R301]NML83819.1 hypothetical protein [Streptomyces sp. R302]
MDYEKDRPRLLTSTRPMPDFQDDLEAMDLSALARRGEYLSEGLRKLNGIGPIRDVRGRGFLYGVEVTEGSLWPLMRAVEDNGVFLYPFTGAGEPKTEGLVIAPPLISTEGDLDFLVTALREAALSLA